MNVSRDVRDTDDQRNSQACPGNASVVVEWPLAVRTRFCGRCRMWSETVWIKGKIPRRHFSSSEASRHLKDLVICRSQMFLSVQSPIKAGGRTFPKHSLSRTLENFVGRRFRYRMIYKINYGAIYICRATLDHLFYVCQNRF